MTFEGDLSPIKMQYLNSQDKKKSLPTVTPVCPDEMNLQALD